MSPIRLIFASLVYHWRIHLSVACGVAAGTAVLTGALLVGDSMRGSLRDLTVERLGRIEEVLQADRFFRAGLADELAADPQFQKHFAAAAPAIMLRASVQWPPTSDGVRVNRVNLLACDERFWQMGAGGPDKPPATGQVVLNQPLAERLARDVGEKPIRVSVGDRVTLRLPQPGNIPSESLLGRNKDVPEGHNLTVSQIIPAEGLGRFSMHASQQLPLNAYVSLDMAKRLFRREIDRRGGRVNAILVASKDIRSDPLPESHPTLQSLLRPTLADYGIRVEETGRGYFNVTSERMLLDPPAERLILKALAGWDVQPALTYLANTIACGGREIPYSTVAAVDFSAEPPLGAAKKQLPAPGSGQSHFRSAKIGTVPRQFSYESLGPFVTPEGRPIAPLEDGQIVLNQWAAEDLAAGPGDTIRLTYFEPESTHGQLLERTVELKLAAVARLAGPADDPGFTPEVPGITDPDTLTMADWDPPFPFNAARIRDKDEQYWEDHRATPKAFVSLSTGRRLWESRFGRTTSLRVAPAEGLSVDDLREKLEAELSRQAASLGFVFQPVKRQGLAASKGTTSFGGLFLGFSFFLIAAAVMLVALLFRLGVDQRVKQVGTLAAVGFGRRKIIGLLAGEGLVVAAVGSLIGIAAGTGYAALMLTGLRTWWVAAVVTPFLRLHADQPTSYLIGYTSGLAVALAAIVWAVWGTRRTPARQLLAGQIGPESPWLGGRPRFARRLAWMTLLGAVAMGLLAPRADEQMQAAAFFGAGALVLVASLALAWSRLRAGALGPAVAVGRGNLLRMALRSLGRNPGRSTLTLGLVASASFLIVSISAFRVDPAGRSPDRESGNGGFALVAESDQPIFHDLDTEEGRQELGFSTQESRILRNAAVYALRVKSGDDASCLNLYKPQQPRILGASGRLIDRGGFLLTPWEELNDAQRENPWLLLRRDLGRDGDGVPRVPALLDAATATYSLHLGKAGNNTLDVTTARGRTIRLQVVGVLPGSILQGDLIISEENLLRCFPEVSGYRFFLVEAEPDRVGSVQQTLERKLSDYGFAAETTGQRLARFLVVQNTYLSTFQSLGGLGLLLGTFGLAAVQLRNVLERRRELALLRATGFRRGTLAWLVMVENGLLLAGGLACGVLAALIAVLPHLVFGGASVPWASLAGMLLLVLVAGLIAGLAAVRAALRAPLLAALREE